MEKYILVRSTQSESPIEEKTKRDYVPSLELTEIALARKLLKQVSVGLKKGRSAKFKGNHAFKALTSTSFSCNSQGVYTFVISILSAIQSSTAGAVLYYASAFNPSAATNWAQLAALFDQYRINKVKLQWVPLSFSLTDVTRPSGVMACAIDTDSVSAPASIDVIMQYDDCWLGSILSPPGGAGEHFTPPYSYTCPKPGQAAGGSTAGNPTLGQWCDIALVANSGSIIVGVESTLANSRIHQFTIEYDLEFRFLR